MSKAKALKEICNQFLDESMEYNDLPGLVIGVSWNGEEFTGARGVRDVVTGDPLQADDVFHCASVSKLFTSSAIMLLVQAGVLNLDDRLCDILPEMFGGKDGISENGACDADGTDGISENGACDAGRTDGISENGACDADGTDAEFGSAGNARFADPGFQEVRLWQMLSHTAGIGDVNDYHWEESLTGEKALADYVRSAEVTDQPLLWEPGKGGFRYSNIAYEILGDIVAVKSALSYEAFIEKFLMEPAGMTDSTMLTFRRLGVNDGERCPLITDEIRRRNAGSDPDWHPMALPHEKATDRSIVPVKYYPYTRSHAPSSTLTSTASDLLKWARVHMQGFMDEHITYEYAEVPNNREKMGLGWFMRRQGGHQLYGHEGTDDGFRASLWICPEQELAIAVLSNLSGAPVKKLNKKLFDRMIHEK